MNDVRILSQGDSAWAGAKLGRSKTATYRRQGCLMTALAQMVRELGIDPECTPIDVQVRALSAWDGKEYSATMPFAAGTGAAVVDVVGRAVGLAVGDRVQRFEGGHMWSTLEGVLPIGRALMHVDTRDDNVDVPNHWVCADRIEGNHLFFRDPDGGVEGRLPLETLAGPGPGGHRMYRVEAVRPVRRA